MKINIKAFALTCGIIAGLVLFVLTIWFLIMGFNGNMLAMLGNIYWGYSVSWIGALIGFVYAFVDGIILGFLFGYLYNRLIK